MKKLFFLTLCLCAFLLGVSCPHDKSSPNPKFALSGKTALEYFNDNALYIGWNLGNGLDSHRDNVGGEMEWGNPRIRQELFDGVKVAGFSVVRIPVTWRGHFGPAPDYTIAQARLDRVAEVVDMAYNAGFQAVIINIHHDDGRPSRDQVQGWLDISKADDPAAIAAINGQFRRAWEQIADRFKDYGDWLIFEPFNEAHNGGWGWNTAENPITEAQFAAVNNWNQTFVDVVRSSGGNNAGRFLLVQPYHAKPHQVFDSHFRWPTDTTGNDGKLILSMHYYEPENFTMQGTGGGWKGTETEKNAIINGFGEGVYHRPGFTDFKKSFADKGVLVVMGECGPAAASNHGSVSAADAYDIEGDYHKDRVAYVSFMFKAAKDNGIIPVYWDNGSVGGDGERFALFNRLNGKAIATPSQAQAIRAVIDAMVNAVE